ncbi:hypothetical protein [Frankia sp. AgB32]|uniref:hypothetical protein n=1 Tax=Frankia sp. AgB32 TaxID=631119 RepID=UPI00200DE39F|nr:hypothetical protein [Frankia sp. AgB32]MCK9894716.1 hypothetical protein [Frankia sp. AgB32]
MDGIALDDAPPEREPHTAVRQDLAGEQRPRQLDMFGDEPCAPGPKPLSAQRHRTARKQDALASGVHPVSGHRLLPESDGKTCGGCLRFFEHGRYRKCRLNATRGPATDLRASWPACTQFLAREEPPDG